MIRIKHILLPTDFSPCANQALDHALFLAKKYGATVHVLHAIMLHEDDPFTLAAHCSDVDASRRRLRELARSEMKAAVSARADASCNLVMRQRHGYSVADVLLDYSNEQNIDLIVMGTHGRHGLEHLFFGSAAERVVRHAPCPVLTIKERESRCAVSAIRRILVPVDFSEHAKSAIRHATEIAEAYGADIGLLHMIDEIPLPGFYDSVGFSLDVIEPDAEEKATEEMRRLYESSAGSDVNVTYQAIIGRAGEGIVEFAKKTGVDLIVVATHGLSGIRHLLIGSVAERVVRMAPCPVFTVKSFGNAVIDDSLDLRSAGTGA